VQSSPNSKEGETPFSGLSNAVLRFGAGIVGVPRLQSTCPSGRCAAGRSSALPAATALAADQGPDLRCSRRCPRFFHDSEAPGPSGRVRGRRPQRGRSWWSSSRTGQARWCAPTGCPTARDVRAGRLAQSRGLRPRSCGGCPFGDGVAGGGVRQSTSPGRSHWRGGCLPGMWCSSAAGDARWSRSGRHSRRRATPTAGRTRSASMGTTEGG
jgi:hypothetical protein